MYLLDADALIRADSTYYPIPNFPVFWDWLLHQAQGGDVQVPFEQFEEVVAGKGDIVGWLKANKKTLVLDEEASAHHIAHVTATGYGKLDDVGAEKVGRDPFLIAYAYAEPKTRWVVTLETSAPSKKGANRKIPDVCAAVGVRCCTLFDLVKALNFTTNWKP